MSARLLGAVFALIGCALALSALAATYDVDSTSADPALSACTGAPDDCSFPGALTRIATVGDTINFTVSSSLATSVQTGRSVTILANGATLPRINAFSSLPTQMTMLIRNARFANLDSGLLGGGALYIQANQTVIVEDSEFSFNRSSTKGGAIYSNGPLTIRRCRFEGNYSNGGAGGIHIEPIANSAITPTLTVIDSTFVANGVLNPGSNPQYGQFGAIKSDVAAQISGSLFERNDAQYGAAIQSGNQLRIYNSTFWRNQTRQPTEGGALLLGGYTAILNSTLVENAGSNAGAMTVYTGTDVWVGNTLIANNTGVAPEIGGRIYSLGGNLVRNRGTAVIAGDGSLNLYDVDPRYIALTNNGGPTATVALQPTSPAIDAGSDCVLANGGCDGVPATGFTTDQRGAGFARKRGLRVDIGAYEVPRLIVTNTANSGAGSLRQTIIDAAANDHIGFDPAVFNQPRTIALGGSALVINKALTITGPGTALLTLDAALGSRHFTIDGSSVQIIGMRLYRGDPGNGVDGGSVLVNSGTTTLTDVLLELNRARNGGCVWTRGTLFGARIRMTGCTASNSGGALYIESSSFTDIADNLIEYSIASANYGGIANLGTLVLRRSTLRNNTAARGGGLGNLGTATLNSITFSTNNGNTDGGAGLYNGTSGTVSLNHPTITLNTAAGDGGGLWNDGGTVNLSNALIAGNTGGAAPDARGVLRSLGYNLTGNTSGYSWDPASPSVVGNQPGVNPRLGPLSDQGTLGPMHPPLYDSPIIDGGGAGLLVDGRGQVRPVDFSNLPNASGGNGNDIGAFELQVSTPTNVSGTPINGAISVAFDGGSNGGQTVTGYLATCGSQTVSGSTSPIVVGGLANGTPVSCSVRAQSATQTGIASAPTPPIVPGEPPGVPTIGAAQAGNGQVMVAFTAAATGGTATEFIASCGARSGTGSTSPVSVFGLPNGIPVDCSVRATNASGTSAASAVSNGVIPGLPGAQAYIPRTGAASVGVFDFGDGSLIGNTGLGSGQSGVAASPDGARVYVVSQVQNTVTVLNTFDRSVVGQISVGPSPWSAAVSPDGLRVYVSNSGDSTVSVINADTRALIATFPVFNQPFGLALSPDGTRLWVAHGGSNAIGVYDTSTYARLGLATVGMDPIGVAMSPDGRRVYATSQTGGTVTAVDTATLAPVGSVATGSQAFGVVVSRDSQRVYVSNAGAGTVSVVNAQSLDLLTQIPVGAQPSGIEVSPDGGRVYVVNRGSSTVSVIDGATLAVTQTLSLGSSAFAMGRFAVAGGYAISMATLPPQLGAMGQPFSFTPEISGVPAASVWLSAGVLPSGLTLNPATGTISGTPTQIGTARVTLSAGNGIGTPVSRELVIVVGPGVPAAPELTWVQESDGVLLLHFQPPASNNGSTIQSYIGRCGDVSDSNITSPVVVDGLSNGVSYNCTVAAVNLIGEGAPSNALSGRPRGAPGAPTIGVATPGPAQVSVVFTAPTSDGGSAITGYTASCGSQSQSGGNSPIVVTGLTNGTPVSCTVIASNAVGNSPPSAASNEVTPVDVPGAPTIGLAVASASLVTVDFTPPNDNGGSPILSYTATCGNQSQTGPHSPLLVGGLPNGVPVRCSVIARNAIGDSTPSAQSNEVIPLGEPGAPTINAVLPDDGKVSVDFSAPADNGGSPILDYTATCGTQTQTGPASPLIVGGLSNGVAVSCTVRARNAVGQGTPSAPSAPVTPAGVPAAPTIRSIVPGNASLSVDFDAVTQTNGAPILDYQLECPPAVQMVSSNALSLQLTGLSNGQRYECRVRARNSAGYGPASAPVAAYPAASLSSDLAISVSNQRSYVTGGEPVSYRIVVSNTGPAGVAGARVQDTLDPEFSGATWTCQPSPGAVCAASGSGNLDQRVDLPVGGSVEFLLTATVAALPETPVSNVAAVSPPVPIDDPQLGNNVASDGPDIRGLYRNGFE